MGLADKIIPHYTYDDWVHWEGIWELLEGHPIAMSPAPVPAHQRAAAELITESKEKIFRFSTFSCCRNFVSCNCLTRPAYQI